MATTALPLPSWPALALASTGLLTTNMDAIQTETSSDAPHGDAAAGDAAAGDAAIIQRSLRDPQSFARLFDRHHEAMWRFAWSRVGDEAAADDLAAEVFRIAFERRHDFDLSYDSAKPWLFGIAANLVRQHHRQRARRSELRDRVRAQPDRDAPPDPQNRLDQLPDAPLVAALRALPERDREPLLLYAWDELSYEEVAEALQVPLGTVRSRIHRARHHLRDELGPDGTDATGAASTADATDTRNDSETTTGDAS